MCLELQGDSFRLTAKRDIVCYKYIEEHNDNSFVRTELMNKLITPFRYAVIEIGETYESDLIKTEYREVEIGLHSFAKKAECRKDSLSISVRTKKMHIVKCVIPKGSEYYVGVFSECKSYASTCLKYIEIVETRELDSTYNIKIIKHGSTREKI